MTTPAGEELLAAARRAHDIAHELARRFAPPDDGSFRDASPEEGLAYHLAYSLAWHWPAGTPDEIAANVYDLLPAAATLLQRHAAPPRPPSPATRPEPPPRPGRRGRPGRPPLASCQPDAEAAIVIQGKLTEAQFRRVFELLGRPPDRYKEWCSGPYHFGSSARYGPLTVELADTVCAYLESIAIPYERATVRRWQPPR